MSRWLLLFDFSCGLTAGLAYALFFDFLISDLGIPRWLAVTQLIANFSYGIFGATLFFSKTNSKQLFKTLMVMNFLYGFFCLSCSAFVKFAPPWGKALLFVEGLFVMFLAKIEQVDLKN